MIKVNIDLISFLWVTVLSLNGITTEMVYFLFDGTKYIKECPISVITQSGSGRMQTFRLNLESNFIFLVRLEIQYNLNDFTFEKDACNDQMGLTK